MAKPKPPSEPHSDVVNWSGVSRSMECVDKNGFRNFVIVTLTIQFGYVIKREVSDPFASFEAIARMEVANQRSTLNLNSGFKAGKTWHD